MKKPHGSGTAVFHRQEFRAMNTDIELMYLCTNEEAAAIERLVLDWFKDAEERFSRFRPGSELNQLNVLAGERCLVTDPMLEILQLAEDYRRITAGVFQPLVLNALERAGYRQSFEQLKKECVPLAAGEPSLGEPAEIFIDPLTKSVQLPTRSGLDLGGIVKSWTVKRLADILRFRFQLTRGFINAGGDLFVWGRDNGNADPWLIGIENPWEEREDIGILALLEGAAATSSKLGRRWQTEQGEMHHLIDPRTMKPSHSNVVQCTVAGPDPIACEIWAKVVCILGTDEGLSLFSWNAEQYEALLFTADRKIQFCGDRASHGETWRNLTVDNFFSKRGEST